MLASQLLRRPNCVPTRRIIVALLFAAALAFSFLYPSTRAGATAPQPAPAAAAAAETVITWRAQDNPHVISGTYVIPVGTKVLVEAGAVIQFSADSTLQVDGELVAQGTAASRIQLQRAASDTSKILVTGTLNLGYADIAVAVFPGSGNATLIFADSSFKKFGYIWATSGYTFKTLPYIQLDRCIFESSSQELPIQTFLTVENATLVMRDVSFTGGAYARVYYSYVYLERITSDGAQQFGLQLRVDGPVYLDNVTVMNSTNGLDLGGGYSPSNYFLGPNVKLEGNNYPINLEGAGLLPGSTVPTQGNANNAIRSSSGGPGTVWGKFAIPYHLYGLPGTSIAGTTIEPGVNVKVAPQTTIDARGNGIRGTADQPIIFDRLDPAQYWFAIGFQDQGSIVEHTIVEGSQGGFQTASNSHSYVYLNDVILRNNETGSGGGIYAIGTQFINNGTGYTRTGGLTAIRGFLDGGPASPNSFVGNGKAISNTGREAIAARYNWWNSPTGPSNYPNGTGDPAFGADIIPFVASKPDYTSDRPPVIRFHKPFHTYVPGSKVTLSWESSDDFGIVAHRVLFSKAGADNYELLAELPGDQRAYEWTVPDIGFQNSGPNAYVRIVAVDSKGHERFDDAEIVIPSSDLTGTITFTTDVAGKTFKTGDTIGLEYTVSEGLRYTVKEEFLLVGGLGPVGARNLVSTDTAQVAVKFSGSGNREVWFYSPQFKIRPDSRIGDQPPVVTLTGPASGTAFASGQVIPVTWTASDDEAVRSFNLEVSYDGGVSWTMIARDLPPTTNSYQIRTAPGTGHADIRVRVTAFDRRFQSSSAGADRSFTTSGVAQNKRPQVTLTSPGTESQFNVGSPVTLTAEASDTDGTVSRVDFYAGNTLVGTSTSAPYRFTWTNAPAGKHEMTAVATDDAGGVTKSAPANVIINAKPPGPGTTAGAVWAAGYNGPSNQGDGAQKMALDAQGNIYVLGDSIGIGTEIDMATVKYDSQGRQLWAVRYAGPGHDFPYDIGLDAQGNVYVTGQTWRRFKFDGGTEQDIVTMKYSPDGELLWTRYYTGTQATSSQDTPSEMEVDAEGNVYVAGMTYRGTTQGYLIGMSVVMKYDTNGNRVWVNTFDGPGENGSVAKQLVLGPSGHIYVAGTVRGYVVSSESSDTDVFAAKYDAAGNVIWRSFYDTPNNPNDFDNVADMKVDTQGNVYLGGNNKPVMGQGSDLLTIKYNPEGTLAWNRRLDISDAEGIGEIALDSAGNIFAVGSAQFRHNGGLTNDDAVTVKYDNNGNHLWTRTYTGMWDRYYVDDAAGNVLVDSAGNAYVGMETRDEAGKYVFGLLKYTPDGTESVRIFRGPNATGDDTLFDMAFDSAGDLYLAGYSFVPAQGANFLLMKVAPGPGLITPMITWNNPADIIYRTPLSDSQLNATVNVPGTLVYTPAAGTVLTTGYHYLSVKFTPADTNTYRSVTEDVMLFVQRAPAGITLGNLSHTYDGTAKAASVVVDPPSINFEVTYSQDGRHVATSYNGAPVGAPIKAGSYDVAVKINSSVYYGNAVGVLVINKATPAVNWVAPLNITSGTALGAAQLNATAGVPGTFQYTPAAGTVLAPGTHQLSMTFTPTDAANYNGVTKTVQLTVAPAELTQPTINWANPADITYGTALGAAQLNAAADVPGTFTYSPAPGTVLNAGSNQTLRMDFTPADPTKYAPASKTVSINVVKAQATVTFGDLRWTYDNIVRAPSVVTDPAGLRVTLGYTRNGVPVARAAEAGSYNVTATVNDANYQGSAMGQLVIDKATPVIIWNDPANIISGMALSNVQLNANASFLGGTYEYDPPGGTVLGVGTHQLSVTFTPYDLTNFTTASKSVQLTVDVKTATLPELGFDAAEYSVAEGAGYVVVKVARSGDISSAATVKYQTSDATDVNFRCDPSTTGQLTGAASRKCDYHIAVGTLRFSAGEAEKQIILSIVNDVYVEGPESFTLSLSNPTGISLGPNSSATITVTDDDILAGQPNPVDDTRFYVRQLYVDLLSREPEPSGWDGWTRRIDLCGQPGQAPPPCDRVTVGGDGFLRSGEFFDRQFFVLRLYRTGLGRILQYSEVGDLAYVSGFLSPADLELNKQELVAEIMSRGEFSIKYDGLSNATFVDTLLQTAGITVPQSVADEWVAALNSNTKTRAQVYREISERPEVSAKYLHEAQVVSAYYGFFTRNPDGAYLIYLDRLNRGEINLGDLTNAFINATEYRQRFGP
jgi:MBG domain/Bacterial Ig domain/Calx-beta domain/Beta-propeller repeat